MVWEVISKRRNKSIRSKIRNRRKRIDRKIGKNEKWKNGRCPQYIPKMLTNFSIDQIGDLVSLFSVVVFGSDI